MPKHLLYLTNHDLIAVHWRAGGVTAERAFAIDERGVEEFAHYAAHSRAYPTYLLTDLIEEDFRLDSVPHVSWRDRAAMLERRLQQMFRSTPYRMASLLGRAAEGRRDDRVLFSALTNVELLRPWLDALHSARLPLAGIYSASLLTEQLLKPLRIRAEHALIVTLQGSAGWRQTYCHEGRVRFSRLTPISALKSTDLGASVADEVRKTAQYLESISALSAEDALDVHVICHPNNTARLKADLLDTAQLRYTFHDLRALAKNLGARYEPADSDAAGIFLHLLADRPPRNQFAPREQQRSMQLWRARNALLAASALALLGGFSWVYKNLLDGATLRAQAAQIQRDIELVRARQRAVVAKLPPTPVSTRTMSEVVTFHERVLRDAPSFNAFAQRVGTILMEFPQIHVEQIIWATDTQPAIQLGYTPRASVSAESGAAVVAENPPTSPGAAPVPGASGYYQRAVLEAAVVPFDDDYRKALSEIDRLTLTLSERTGAEVTQLVLPLDTRSQARLRGKAGPQRERGDARFALELRIGPQTR